METCQRWIWVGSVEGSQNASGEIPACVERATGTEAYSFLLRVATGLESRVVGETDVFGQLKEAWRQAELSGLHEENLKIRPWMYRVFEDSKEIRSRFLQNSGGTSYGSLVRKLLRDRFGKRVPGSILLVGAGLLARGVAPYLLELLGPSSSLFLANRSKEKLHALVEELDSNEESSSCCGHGFEIESQPKAQVRILESEADEKAAWQQAAAVVVCIPFDSATDRARIQSWKEGGADRSLIHLGGHRSECGDWSELSGFHCLEDIFNLQKSLGEVRSIQIGAAVRACGDRAKLRALGGSLSIPHGWEDLAVFA